MALYYLIGDAGTNIIKKDGGDLLYLTEEGKWQVERSLLDYFVNGAEMKPLTKPEAKQKAKELFPGLTISID